MPRLNIAEEIYRRSMSDIVNPIITTEEINHFIANQPSNGYDIDRATDSICYNGLAYTYATAESRCKCCGRQMYIPYYVNGGFCDSCKALIAEEMFNPKNQNFTCNNVINIIRGKIIDAI